MDRQRHNGANGAGEGLRLLIIDDEPNHAEAVAESLQRVGYDCVIATSGKAGARLIGDEEPDVILTDKTCRRPRSWSSPATATCKPRSKP